MAVAQELCRIHEVFRIVRTVEELGLVGINQDMGSGIEAVLREPWFVRACYLLFQI